MKRAVIYVYWDQNGVLQDHALFCIKQLTKFFSKTLVVINGTLNSVGKKEIEDSNAEFLERPNVGYDFYAYRDGINFLRSKTNLNDFDELLLLNSSVYGPLYPLENVFDLFSRKNYDFWGLTQWHGFPHPDHIQSYFLVFRRKLIISDSFENFWSELPKIEDRQSAIKNGEIRLTKYFEDRGFSWATLCGDTFKDLDPNPTIHLNNVLIDLGVPFIKKKYFYSDYNAIVSLSFDGEFSRTIDNIKNKTNFDFNLILSDLINTTKPSANRRSLHNIFILPTDRCNSSSINKETDISVIFYVFFKDLVSENIKRINQFPSFTKFYFVSSNQEILDCYKESDINKIYRTEYRLQPNRGRNERAYFLTCEDVIKSSDYICLLHDKKIVKNKPLVQGMSMRHFLYDSLIYNKNYISNVIDVFEKNEKIGLLMPALPIFSGWSRVLLFNPYTKPTKNIETAKKLYDELKIKVPFDDVPEFPCGSMFWIRKGAINSFYNRVWKEDDFPKEPIETDGTILHALERMYPTIAQNSGYLSAWIIPDLLTPSYIDNLLTQIQYSSGGMLGLNSTTLPLYNSILSSSDIKSKDVKLILKRYFKKKLNKLIQKL